MCSCCSDGKRKICCWLSWLSFSFSETTYIGLVEIPDPLRDPSDDFLQLLTIPVPKASGGGWWGGGGKIASSQLVGAECQTIFT